MSVEAYELPDSSAQDWLLDQLGILIRRCGAEPLLRWPMLEPTDRHFPDAWTPDVKGLWVLVKRLLLYAHLPRLTPKIEVMPEQHSPDDVAAWFSRLDGDQCLFGTRAGLLNNAERLVPAMAHEVAHAYRHAHGLDRDDPDEELLTDLTTVYLGFGILTLNGTFQSRSSLVSDGTLCSMYSQWAAGYLPPGVMAFLLAVQSVLREDADAHEVAGRLEANQAAAFRKAVRLLDGRRSELRRRLWLDAVRDGGQAATPRGAAADPISIPSDITVSDEPTPADPQPSRPVFRVRTTRSREWMLAVAGGLLGLVGAVFLQLRADWAFGVLLGTGAVGFISGRRWVRDECSDPDCAAVLPPDAARCPRCHGPISGRIRHRSERLDAEERLADR